MLMMAERKKLKKTNTQHLMDDFVVRRAQFFSSTPDPNHQTSTMENAIYVATRVENDIYKTANSLSQYYDAMVQRCLLMVKERSKSTVINDLIEYCADGE